MIKCLYCSLFVVLSCMGCTGKKVYSVEEYSKWINDPENGLTNTRRIKGLKITVKHLPVEYLIYKEQKENNNSSNQFADSLKKAYNNSLTFLMMIAPDEEKGNKNDVMLEGITNYQEYTQRLLAMNFALDKSIRLQSGKVQLKPVLSALENTYGLSKSRNIVFVFAPTAKEKQEINHSGELDFIYTDELFQLGIMHFNFNTKNITELPLIGEK